MKTNLENLMVSWRRIRFLDFNSARLALLCAMIVCSATHGAFGAVDDDDVAPARSGVRASADRARHRLYAGGRDEQDLVVQAGLPLPSRSPEGPTVESEAAGDSAQD